MIAQYKVVGIESGDVQMSGRHSSCIRWLNGTRYPKKEAVKIIPSYETFCVGFDTIEEKAKRAFLESKEEEETFWIKNEGSPQVEDGKKRRVCDWTEEEDHLLLNCKSYADAKIIGLNVGKSQAAVWARVRRFRRKAETEC